MEASRGQTHLLKVVLRIKDYSGIIMNLKFDLIQGEVDSFKIWEVD